MKSSRFNKWNKYIVVVCGLICITTIAQAQKITADTIPLKHGAHRNGNRTDPAMQRWRDYGLGQFIHWGLYAIPGGKWQDKTYNGASEWIRSWTEPTAPNNWKNTYDNLYKQFNPQNFDATQWAKQAKEMGAKYIIFTTKHHDGFCLWPSKFTNYTIANTPYKKDIVKEVVEAYDAQGIDVYLYFSIIDWNHIGYKSAAPKTKADSVSYNNFKQFTKNQLVELLTKYPKTKGFWFDGTWDEAWVKEAAFTDELEKELRSIHPGLIIGSRFRADELGKRHFDANGKMMGDYEQGWERKLPASVELTKGRDWDAVMTIPPNQWGYNSDWSSSYLKTPYDLLQLLMQAVSQNGNLVINFGPDGNGKIRKEETEIATSIGNWMKTNNSAVYNTTNAALAKPDYGYFTQNETNLYLTVFNIPINKTLRISFPKNHNGSPAKANLLVRNEALILKPVNIGFDKDTNSYYDIVLPENFETKQPFVIKIKLEKLTQNQQNFGDAKI